MSEKREAETLLAASIEARSACWCDPEVQRATGDRGHDRYAQGHRPSHRQLVVGQEPPAPG